MVLELDPVDRITADAVGEPGQRVFYLQAHAADRTVTLLVEKQQVQLLAASIVEILARIGKETGTGPAEEEMGLQEPIVPEWRAGRLSIGYREDRDLLVLEAEEVLPEEDEGDEEEEEEGEEEEEALFGVGEGSGEERGNGHEPEDEDEEEDGEDEGDGEDGEGGEEDEGRATGVALSEIDELEAAFEGMERPEPKRVRFWATREQMLSLARHGAAVCSRGRPRCQLCGNPIDPEGHVCPALNGHGEYGGE